jgi:hypothetical protein
MKKKNNAYNPYLFLDNRVLEKLFENLKKILEKYI